MSNNPLDNAVLRLRKQRIARSTRPFRARGSRAVRCECCLLPQSHCICHSFNPVQANSRFCLLMYDTEPMKPSNTGRLIADILPTTKAFMWARTEVDQQLLLLLNNPDYQPYVVFPATYAATHRPVTSFLVADIKKTPLFILLDGTWPEACKMFRHSPYLNQLPLFSFGNEIRSAYLLREAQHQEQYCTVEVAIKLLEQAEDWLAAKTLASHFDRFKLHYLAAKFNQTVESFMQTPSRTNK